MTTKKILLLLISLVSVGLGSLWALEDEIGQIVYLEGTVDIIRNAKVLGSGEVGFGTIVQNMDQIKVGRDGFVEITLDENTGVPCTITIRANSALVFDISSLQKKQSANVDLLAGSVGLKVSKLSSGNKLNVQTGTASMGVRGTQFEVSFAVSGDVLLSTSEGDVECITEDGNTLHSIPGLVIEGSSDNNWTSQEVAVGDLGSFRAQWMAKKIDAFKANPGKATLQYAQAYLKHIEDFNAAYTELFRQRDVINKWIREDRIGTLGTNIEQMKEKKALIASLRKLRTTMIMLERIYYRLDELEGLYRQGIAASGQISRGMSVAAFFNRFAGERKTLAQKMADVSYVTKLYAKRNNGKFPLGMQIDEEDF